MSDPATDPPHRDDHPGAADPPAPPRGSGIAVERAEAGLRVTLPRRYSRGDVVAAGLSAAVAIWVGVWLDATSSPGSRTLAWFVMAGVGVLFAALAASEAVSILTRQVIEDAGDRIVLSRQVGVRRVLRTTLPKSRIRSIERTWRADDPGAVEIQVGEDAHRVGKGLEGPALEWLEGVLGGMGDAAPRS